MSMPAALYYTAEMVRALPDDGNRYETVHGELLVTPSPRKAHQAVLGRLYLALGNYLAGEGIEGLFLSPADISWSPDTLVQPDLFVADPSEAGPGEWSDIRTLHLAIEILSPSSLRADRFTKRRLYQEQRIPAPTGSSTSSTGKSRSGRPRRSSPLSSASSSPGGIRPRRLSTWST